jgi:hypothetical protein
MSLLGSLPRKNRGEAPLFRIHPDSVVEHGLDTFREGLTFGAGLERPVIFIEQDDVPTRDVPFARNGSLFRVNITSDFAGIDIGYHVTRHAAASIDFWDLESQPLVTQSLSEHHVGRDNEANGRIRGAIVVESS